MTAVTDNGVIDDIAINNADSRNVTDASQRQRGTLSLTAIRNADCHFCKLPIAATEPLWRIRIRTGEYTNGYPLDTRVPACRECAVKNPGIDTHIAYWVGKPLRGGSIDTYQRCYPGFRVTDDKLFSYCMGCRRLLGATCVWPEVHCSPECTRAARNQRRRITPQQHECATCSKTFTPPRSDGRYCSPACRQRAYRQRQA